MIKTYLLILLCSIQPDFIQNSPNELPKEVIRKNNFDQLFDKIDKAETGSRTQSFYLQAFLMKAKEERNWEEIVNSYKNYLHYSEEHLRLVYADSMIYSAQMSGDTVLMGSAHLTKGIVYYSQKRHNKALDHYLKANELISRTNDEYLKYKVKYNIAHIKYYLGYYNEAISLFGECLTYFKKENDRAYLNTLHSLGLCYNRMGNYGLCTETNELGLSESERLQNSSMKSYFVHSEGINQSRKENYALAIENLKKALPVIKENGDFANVTVGYFYLGKSYWAMNQAEKALPYFRKVDQSFEERNYIRPDLRENYELLIHFYENSENPGPQLHYIKKLLRVDSVLSSTFKYLSGKIHKEYDTKRLVLERDRIERQLQKRKQKDTIWISVVSGLVAILLLGVYRYFRNQKIYRRKFEELMKKNGTPNNTVKGNSQEKTNMDINPEAVDSVLKQLEKFERGKKFLEKDITLVKLSAAFNSNTKYLSKVISFHRGKGFVEYLNDLKIDYIVNLLRKDKIYRNYTNKALAEAVGFSSTQRFTKAFKSRTGISPSYFSKEIRKKGKLINPPCT